MKNEHLRGLCMGAHILLTMILSVYIVAFGALSTLRFWATNSLHSYERAEAVGNQMGMIGSGLAGLMGFITIITAALVSLPYVTRAMDAILRYVWRQLGRWYLKEGTS